MRTPRRCGRAAADFLYLVTSLTTNDISMKGRSSSVGALTSHHCASCDVMLVSCLNIAFGTWFPWQSVAKQAFNPRLIESPGSSSFSRPLRVTQRTNEVDAADSSPSRRRQISCDNSRHYIPSVSSCERVASS